MGAFSENTYVYDLGSSALPGTGVAEPSATRLCIAEEFFELGHRVWDTCAIMCKYFEAVPEAVAGKVVLEVGAGTGLLGLVVHRVGAERVLLTEYGRCVERMVENVQRNGALAADPSTISCCMLDWNDVELPPEVLALMPDVVLAADITLFPSDVPKIESLFRRLLELKEDMVLFLGCQDHREATAPFMEVARQTFEVEEVPRESWHPDFRTDLHHIYKLRRRQS
mmetsp:Transcript_18797/g.57117  ORF Transcript_18797/g.57117 Transcript_18797/m.57117 type:complete len:225 (+) Transcript_18797:211-885(+)